MDREDPHDSADWPHVYPCGGEAVRVPEAVRQAGRHARHVLRCGYFGVQLGWQASDDCVLWWWVLQTA